jgi:predicted GIY-YIG superfamily endonuclease
MTQTINADPANAPHEVYGFYDAADRLIYVGCTVNLAQRSDQHRTQSWWWWQVRRTDVLAHAETRAEGRALERAAIIELRPRWNQSPKPPQKEWGADDYMDRILAQIGARTVCCTRGLSALTAKEERLVMAANAYHDLDLPLEPLALVERIARGTVLTAALIRSLQAGRTFTCQSCEFIFRSRAPLPADRAA